MSEHFGPDALEIFDVEQSLESRSVAGGTSREILREQLAAAEAALLANP